MLVSREEFVESLSYMEITTLQMLDFINNQIENLGPIDLWKKQFDCIMAVHHPEEELFAIQKYDKGSIDIIINSGDYLAVSLQSLLKPLLQ